jgi:Flp pilus assembly protein TadG
MLKTMTRLRRASSGMAAVEFALILPALLFLVFGSIEVTNLLICKADVSRTASTAADLVAQSSQVTDGNMTNIFSALNALVYPFPTANSKIIITSIIDDGHGGGKVAWSDGYHATPHAPGTPMPVPAGLITSGGSVIYSEVTYPYQSTSTYMLKSTITMQNNFYSHPRRVAQVSRVH